VFDLHPDDLSTAGSCVTALARRHRTNSLGRVEVTDRDDMPLGPHDPRAETRPTEAVLNPSAVGVVHEAAGQRDAISRAVARDKPVATSVVIPAIMADVEEVEVVVAHHERATLRVGDVFLKIDADQTRTDVEVEAMATAPIPTPEVLGRKPPVLALAALPGTALGRLGEPSIASSAAWAVAGAAARMLHDAPLPLWPGLSLDELASRYLTNSVPLHASSTLKRSSRRTPTIWSPSSRSSSSSRRNTVSPILSMPSLASTNAPIC
jgi:hypothetical protein